MSPCSDTKISEYQHLFRSTPNLAYHHIPTTGNPVHVPTRRIPDHYKHEIEQKNP